MAAINATFLNSMYWNNYIDGCHQCHFKNKDSTNFTRILCWIQQINWAHYIALRIKQCPYLAAKVWGTLMIGGKYMLLLLYTKLYLFIFTRDSKIFFIFRNLKTFFSPFFLMEQRIISALKNRTIIWHCFSSNTQYCRNLLDTIHHQPMVCTKFY